MRILFALTMTLGVFTPTLTLDTATGIPRIDDIAQDLRAAEPQQVSKRVGKVEVDGSDKAAANPEHLDADKKVVASKTDEPVDAKPPAVASAEPQKISKPLGKVEVDASDKDEANPEHLDADKKAVAMRTEEPVDAEPPAAVTKDDDEDDLPTTVEIERVCEALADAAIAHDLPVGFFARLIWQESKFDQWARSPVGAQGVAQFMPPTAAEYGLEDPFDPIESVAASARFLRELHDQFGNLGLAAAAYNAGGGRIRRWLNGQSSMPQETRKYVDAITGHPPKRWTVRKPLEISFALPRRAPCDGIEGLSRSAAVAQHDVQLTELSEELIAEAETARRAKLAAARAARNKNKKSAKASKDRKPAVARAAKKATSKTAAKRAKPAARSAAKSKSKTRFAQGHGGAGS